MSRFWMIVASLFGPGVAQALANRRVAAGVLIAATGLALLGLGFTIYALPVFFVVYAVSIIDTIIYATRGTLPAQGETLQAAVVWVVLALLGTAARTFVAEAFKTPSTSMSPTLAIGDHLFITKLRSYERGDVVVFRHPCSDRDYLKRVIALGNDTVEVRCNVVYVNGKPVPSKLVKADASYQDTDGDGQWYTRACSRYRETLGGHTFDVFHDAERPSRGEAPDQKDFPLDSMLHNCSNQGDYDSKPSATQRPGEIVEGTATSPCAPQRHFVVPAGHIFVMGDNRSNSNDSRYWGAVPVASVKGKVTGIWLPFKRFGSVD